MNSKTAEPQFHQLDDVMDACMLEERRLFISGPIDMKLAEKVIRKIWYLEHLSSTEDVLVVINSPGGAVDAGFAIWDQLQMVSFSKTTLVTGLAASMGSVLSLVAPKERRFATPMSRFMIHQPALSAAVQGQATDLEIQAKEIIKTKQQLISLYSQATGKEGKELEKAMDRDNWMTAEEAKNFGLICDLVTSYKDI